MNRENLENLTQIQLYDLLILTQEVLLEKRTHEKYILEEKEEFGIKYHAFVNEIRTLKQGLATLRLFKQNIMETNQ